MKFFMLMLTVFILAFGVPSYSLIYGVQKFSWHIPREIVNLAYWQIFGELNALEAFESKHSSFEHHVNVSSRSLQCEWLCNIYFTCCIHGGC